MTVGAEQPDDRIARLEIRLRPEDKAIIEAAAALGEESVSAFVRRAALIEGKRLLRQQK